MPSKIFIGCSLCLQNYEPSSVGIQELYSMGCEPDRKDFLDKLVEFLAERNTPLIKIPTIEKAPVDLYKLYHLVKENGGVENVIRPLIGINQLIFRGGARMTRFMVKKGGGVRMTRFMVKKGGRC